MLRFTCLALSVLAAVAPIAAQAPVVVVPAHARPHEGGTGETIVTLIATGPIATTVVQTR
ncbi:MAG: hypothetical protein AB1635_19530 [Acidobacteriota bacterium]